MPLINEQTMPWKNQQESEMLSYKRLFMMLVAVVPIVLMAANTQAARLTAGGYLFGSVVYNDVGKGVGGGTKLYRVVVTVEDTFWEFRCKNPQGNGDPSSMNFALQEDFVGVDDIVESEIDKQGKVQITATANPEVIAEEYAEALCTEQNRNFTVGGVLLLEFMGLAELESCDQPVEEADGSLSCPLSVWSLEDALKSHCFLDDQYSLDNPPEPGTEYLCEEVAL